MISGQLKAVFFFIFLQGINFQSVYCKLLSQFQIKQSDEIAEYLSDSVFYTSNSLQQPLFEILGLTQDQESLLYFLNLLFKSLIQDIILPTQPLPEEAKLEVDDQIRYHNLSFEQFNITTEDGYILSLWHVWNPQKLDKDSTPVFMQHGLIDIAGTWFFNEPMKSQAYILANQGRDIWLGNSRGTVNSYSHVNLTIKDKQYWQYTFEEMGRYDLPANIKFILQKTGKEQIVYVGHSQGTLQFWLSNIFYNYDNLGKHFKAMVAFAPVMYVGNQNSLFATLFMKYGIDTILENELWHVIFFKKGENLFDDLINKYSPLIVEHIPRTTWAFVQSMVGFNKKSHMNVERMPVMAKNDIGGSGTLNLRHYSQLARSGNFESLEKEGQPPVSYDVSLLKDNLRDTQLLLFVGQKDALSQPNDLQKLLPLLPQNQYQVIKVDDYNHLDYMWAQDIDQKINKEFLDFVMKF